MARRGVVKAYPIAILNWHEVVNDQFGAERVVVTFCPLCGTGMAFLATVDGRALTFGVSGLLYNSDVLLYDRQTGSLWSQIMTTAIRPLKAQRLTMTPVAHTSWADWRRRHPETLVLSPDTGHQRDYVQSEQVMFPLRFKSQRFHPKEAVIGVVIDGRAKAYPFSALERAATSLTDTFGTRPVRIEYDAAHRTGQEIPSVIGFWFAWYGFHPDTEVYTAAPER